MGSDLDRIKSRFRFEGSFYDHPTWEAYAKLAESIERVRNKSGCGEISIEDQEEICLGSHYFSAMFNSNSPYVSEEARKDWAEAMQVLIEAEFFCFGKYKRLVRESFDRIICEYDDHKREIREESALDRVAREMLGRKPPMRPPKKKGFFRNLVSALGG